MMKALKGRANLPVCHLPVCRNAQQGIAHLFGDYGRVAQIISREGERPREPWWRKNDGQNRARQEPRPPPNIAAAIWATGAYFWQSI